MHFSIEILDLEQEKSLHSRSKLLNVPVILLLKLKVQ
jgi:hypothetical protein